MHLKNIQWVSDTGKCSACGACLTVCPSQAISMKADDYGYVYPRIDVTTCIHCGKCTQVCCMLEKDVGKKPFAGYAAIGRCEALVTHSASGGVFASVAQRCIDDGFYVAGAVMHWEKNDGKVFHILSNSVDDLCQMQGSKYVQSEAWKCYEDVLKTLRTGKNVLFTGTPCQISAIRKLTGNPENLITMDLICHGVPSISMLNDYAKILAKRFRGELVGLCFRDKSCMKSFCARIEIKQGRKRKNYFLRSHLISFYKYFLEGSIYRENCYSCSYACEERLSDITIGDYWGINQFHGKDFAEGKMPHSNNWSCILVNTDKGAQFLNRYGQALYLYPSRPEWIAKNNQQLNSPSQKPMQRDSILARYRAGGYRAVEDAFIHENGGYLRFYWRMLKNLYQNKNTMQKKG